MQKKSERVLSGYLRNNILWNQIYILNRRRNVVTYLGKVWFVKKQTLCTVYVQIEAHRPIDCDTLLIILS